MQLKWKSVGSETQRRRKSVTELFGLADAIVTSSHLFPLAAAIKLQRQVKLRRGGPSYGLRGAHSPQRLTLIYIDRRPRGASFWGDSWRGTGGGGALAHLLGGPPVIYVRQRQQQGGGGYEKERQGWRAVMMGIHAAPTLMMRMMMTMFLSPSDRVARVPVFLRFFRRFHFCLGEGRGGGGETHTSAPRGEALGRSSRGGSRLVLFSSMLAGRPN